MSTKSYNADRISAIQEVFRKSVLVFDGGMGTELYKHGIFTNRCFDELNTANPALIQEIHRSYLEAGADVLTTNTIGADVLTLGKYGLAEKMDAINAAGVQAARTEIEAFQKSSPKFAAREFYIAGSVGSLAGSDAPEAQVVAAIAGHVQALLNAGVDFVMFETIPTAAAASHCVQAVVEVQKARQEEIPFVLSFRAQAEGEDSTLKVLWDVANQIKCENTPRPFAWGLNCGMGPDEILDLVQDVISFYKVPWIIQPNSGVPKRIDDRSINMTSPEFFREYIQRYINLGAKGVGGCCGIGPEHIREMSAAVKPLAKARKGEVNLKPEKADVHLLEPVPLAECSALGQRLASGRWMTSVELLPPLGFEMAATIEKCRRLKEMGINCVNIPDGPRASCRVSALVAADRIQQGAGMETVLHFCCRDRNLIGMQADMLGCAACGINNILFITGDPPKLGNYPDATGVFDTDSVGALKILGRLNRGVDLSGASLPKGMQTHIVMGSGLDPTALDLKHEVEKFHRKAAAGAQFAITQPVFNPETLIDILKRVKDTNVPILAGVYPLASYNNALFMQELPGVNIPDSIMQRMKSAQTKEEQITVGVEVAREAIEQIRPYVAGIQVSAPFGNIDIVARVLDGFLD